MTRSILVVFASIFLSAPLFAGSIEDAQSSLAKAQNDYFKSLLRKRSSPPVSAAEQLNKTVLPAQDGVKEAVSEKINSAAEAQRELTKRAEALVKAPKKDKEDTDDVEEDPSSQTAAKALSKAAAAKPSISSARGPAAAASKVSESSPSSKTVKEDFVIAPGSFDDELSFD